MIGNSAVHAGVKAKDIADLKNMGEQFEVHDRSSRRFVASYGSLDDSDASSGRFPSFPDSVGDDTLADAPDDDESIPDKRRRGTSTTLSDVRLTLLSESAYGTIDVNLPSGWESPHRIHGVQHGQEEWTAHDYNKLHFLGQHWKGLLMKYFDVDAEQGRHRRRKLTSEFMHLLAALMALSMPSSKYREYYGDVRSWASVRNGIYFEKGKCAGTMLPLAMRFNKEVGLGLSTYEHEWSWAKSQDEDQGFISPGVAQRALQDPEAVCKT